MPSNKGRAPLGDGSFPNKDPWKPPKYDLGDADAIQALGRGEATADQQIRVLVFIQDVICNRNDMSYRPGPDGDRNTVFAEGKRYVGNQIFKLSTLPLGKLRGND